MTMDALSIYLLTWNVVTVEPPPIDQLQTLLDNKADFIAVGLQEVKSQPQNIVADALYEDSWTNSIRDVLARNDYVKIHTIRLVGILLSLYSKRKHLTSIRNIETSYTRTGLRGFWGNKGAVSIRFNYKGSSICLVNCHLSPHDKMLNSRIADYHSIINSQSFRKEKISSILDHDLVFWFGDLNFRLEADSFSTNEIVSFVSQNDLKPLLEQDELNRTISNQQAFEGFSECKIDFKPTYKFKLDTQEYDKKRRPAWTDRIIYKTFDNSTQHSQQINEIDQVTCKNYESHTRFTMSDHKPVSAKFDIKVKGGRLDVVTFDDIPSWTAGTEGKIVFTLPSSIEPSSWNWIAFYREHYSSLGEYVSYVWAPQQALPNRKRSYEVIVPESSLRIPGRYTAAYMSDTNPYHFMGISPVFEVTRN